MSYPDPRYLGSTGERSARVRTVSAGPDLIYPNGTTVDYLATDASTDGLFGLYRWSMAGPRTGPGPHFHRTIAESFYVLTGTVRIYDGGTWRDAVPGDFIHVPPGGIHGFRNESGAPASMLILFAPGAPREAYFEGNARFAAGDRPSDQGLAAFYEAHDNIWVEET
jgi:mannose-6-phosphate isomerase-like protein (cupin superfamily)